MSCLLCTKGFITQQPQLTDPSQEMSIWTSPLAETTPHRRATFQFEQQKTITSRISPQNFWKGKIYYPPANYLERQWNICLSPVRYVLEKWRCLLFFSTLKFLSPELNTWLQTPIIGMFWYWRDFEMHIPAVMQEHQFASWLGLENNIRRMVVKDCLFKG